MPPGCTSSGCGRPLMGLATLGKPRGELPLGHRAKAISLRRVRRARAPTQSLRPLSAATRVANPPTQCDEGSIEGDLRRSSSASTVDALEPMQSALRSNGVIVWCCCGSVVVVLLWCRECSVVVVVVLLVVVFESLSSAPQRPREHLKVAISRSPKFSSSTPRTNAESASYD